jgi:predicted patatin/cPLA2 family phospholipase
MIKAVVIGGGGLEGINTISKLEELHKQGERYNFGVGTSTGAMMLCHALLGNFDILAEAYISVMNSDVYKTYPFNKKGDISTFQVIVRAWKGYATIGDMSPLLALVRKHLTIDHYSDLRASGKRAIIAVLNMTTGLIEYKCSDDHDYWEFTKYISAAATPQILGNYWSIDNWEYADAGLATLVPIGQAINEGAEYIDVFTHRAFKRDIRNNKILDVKSLGKTERIVPMINSIARCVRIHREQLEHLEIREGVKTCLMEGVEPTVYYLDSKFKGNNPMIMNPDLSKRMYEYQKQQFGRTDFRVKYTKENYKYYFNIQDRLDI